MWFIWQINFLLLLLLSVGGYSQSMMSVRSSVRPVWRWWIVIYSYDKSECCLVHRHVWGPKRLLTDSMTIYSLFRLVVCHFKFCWKFQYMKIKLPNAHWQILRLYVHYQSNYIQCGIGHLLSSLWRLTFGQKFTIMQTSCRMHLC